MKVLEYKKGNILYTIFWISAIIIIYLSINVITAQGWNDKAIECGTLSGEQLAKCLCEQHNNINFQFQRYLSINRFGMNDTDFYKHFDTIYTLNNCSHRK